MFALILVVGLLGAAWAGDEFVRNRSEEGIAARVVETTGAPRVGVVIGGFPYLTQVVAGSLDHVELDIPELTLAGVRLVDAHVVARGVSTAEPTTIAALTAAAVLPVTEIDRLFKAESGLGADVAIRGDALAITGEILGAELAVEFRPELADGGIALEPETLSLGGRRVDVSRLGGLIGITRAVLPVQLPDGLRIAAIEVLPDGVHLRIDGTDFTPDESLFR